MTVLEILSAATDYLEKHGVESARLNVEHLLAKVLGKKRLDLYLEFERPLGEVERAPLRELIRQRAGGIPLQHLLGTVDFMGNEFYCDGRALVPRSETEQLLEWVLEEKCAKEGPVLDVGTGSGVIAITLALSYPTIDIHAIDISDQALALANKNASHLSVKNINFSQGDLFPPHPERYSLVVANLPYIPKEEISSLSREVQHDPLQALDGGDDGLKIIRRLIDSAPGHLFSEGRIFLEIGLGQGQSVHKLLENQKFKDIQIRCDYQGVERFVSARIE